MSAANPLTEPDRDIPLTEIPKTIRDLRESWAREYSRANQLERKLADTKAECDVQYFLALRAAEERNTLSLTLARIQKAADEGDDYYLQLARKERDFAREEVRRLDVERLEMVVEIDRLRRQLDDRTVELDRVLREKAEAEQRHAAVVESHRALLTDSRSHSSDLYSLVCELLKSDAVGEDCTCCGGWDEKADEPTECQDCFSGRAPK